MIKMLNELHILLIGHVTSLVTERNFTKKWMSCYFYYTNWVVLCKQSRMWEEKKKKKDSIGISFFQMKYKGTKLAQCHRKCFMYIWEQNLSVWFLTYKTIDACTFKAALYVTLIIITSPWKIKYWVSRFLTNKQNNRKEIIRMKSLDSYLS